MRRLLLFWLALFWLAPCAGAAGMAAWPFRTAQRGHGQRRCGRRCGCGCGGFGLWRWLARERSRAMASRSSSWRIGFTRNVVTPSCRQRSVSERR